MLVTGPPAPPRPPLPHRLRALTLAVVLVLGAGVLAAVDQREQPPAVPRLTPLGVPGVSAQAFLDQERELAARLAFRVLLAGEETGRGDTNGPAEPEQLRLVDVVVRGYQVRPVDRSLPLTLGPVGRFGSGLRRVVPFDAEVVVSDCSVDVRAPRSITLSLRRGDGPVRQVAVQSEPQVVRALDDLVRRTCRRPRG